MCLKVCGSVPRLHICIASLILHSIQSMKHAAPSSSSTKSSPKTPKVGELADPRPTSDVNPAQLQKKSQAAKAIIKQRRLFTEPQRLKPRTVGVHEWNRKGVPPNIVYVHRELHSQISSDGMDSDRCIPGIVIRYTTKELVKKQLDHQMKIASSRPQAWPPVFAEEMNNFSLAGTHFTLLMRLSESEQVSALTNRPFSPPSNDPTWIEMIEQGHLYWILSEETTQEEAYIISEWRNSDQNQNQANNESTLIKNCENAIIDESRLNPSAKALPVVTIIQRADRDSIVKLKPTGIGSCAKFVSALGAPTTSYTEEFLQFHSTFVNPRELACSPSFFEDCARALGKTRQILMLSVARAQYDQTMCLQQVRPQPDTCRLISCNDLNALAKREQELDKYEELRKSLREQVKPYIMNKLNVYEFYNIMLPFELLVARLLLNKGKPPECLLWRSCRAFFEPNVHGHLTEARFETLKQKWAVQVQTAYPELAAFTADCGISVDQVLVAVEGPMDMVSIGDSEQQSALLQELGFALGDQMEVIRRFTASDSEGTRADINVGHIVWIAGAEVKTNGSVFPLVSIKKNVGGLSWETTATVNAAHLKLVEAAPSPSTDVVKPPAGYGFLGESAAGTKVRIFKDWPKNELSGSQEYSLNALKHKLNFAMEELSRCYVPYGPQDFILVERSLHDKGNGVEVWTARDFAAGAILLSPLGPEIKDRHFTTVRATFVRDSQNHNMLNKPLMLDGRTRANPDPEQGYSAFSLFFAVERTDEKAKVNLLKGQMVPQVTIDFQPLEGSMKATPKAIKHDGLSPTVIPPIPVLYNPKKVLARVRLWTFNDGDLKVMREKELEEKVNRDKKEKVKKENALKCKRTLKLAKAKLFAKKVKVPT